MQDDLRCLQSKGIEPLDIVICKHNVNGGFILRMWQNLVKIMLSDPDEIQVSQKVDRQGNQYWQVYDRVTGKSFASASEGDIRMWMEQIHRY